MNRTQQTGSEHSFYTGLVTSQCRRCDRTVQGALYNNERYQELRLFRSEASKATIGARSTACPA